MKLVELLDFLWDGVDIPITKDEIQHSVNVMAWGLKKEITSDKEIKELNDQYKIEHFGKSIYNN